jgi:F-type H+-transporting ATPase subunit alpha
MDVPMNRVKEFESKFLDLMRGTQQETLDALRAGKYDDSLTAVLEKVAKDLKSQFIDK